MRKIQIQSQPAGRSLIPQMQVHKKPEPWRAPEAGTRRGVVSGPAPAGSGGPVIRSSLGLTLAPPPVQGSRGRGPGPMAIGALVAGGMVLAMLAGAAIVLLMRGEVRPPQTAISLPSDPTTLPGQNEGEPGRIASNPAPSSLAARIVSAVASGKGSHVGELGPGERITAACTADLNGDGRAEHVLVGDADNRPWLAVVDAGVLRLLVMPWRLLHRDPSAQARVSGQLVDADADGCPDIVLRVIDPIVGDDLLIWSGRTLDPRHPSLPFLSCNAGPRRVELEIDPVMPPRIVVRQPIAVPGEPPLEIEIRYAVESMGARRVAVPRPAFGSAGQWLAFAAACRELGATDDAASVRRDGLALGASTYEAIRGGSTFSYDEFRRALSR